MEQLLPELLRQGIMGLVAGIFFWLYMTERKEHSQTRKEKDALMDARRIDAKETTDNIVAPLQNIAQGINLLSEKIEIGKGRR
jgi:hypothetical protein